MGLRPRGSKTIVNISSVVGVAVEMLNGVYSASKPYVLSFGHSVQKDVADTSGFTITPKLGVCETGSRTKLHIFERQTYEQGWRPCSHP